MLSGEGDLSYKRQNLLAFKKKGQRKKKCDFHEELDSQIRFEDMQRDCELR